MLASLARKTEYLSNTAPCWYMAQSRFIWGPRTSENPSEAVAKILGLVGIPLMGRLRHTAINLILQSTYNQGGGRPLKPKKFRFQTPDTNARQLRLHLCREGSIEMSHLTGETSRYLSFAPPAYECGTRPFLRWVLSQGRSPTRQAVPKMPRTPSAFPFSGRLRRRAINPTPPKRV